MPWPSQAMAQRRLKQLPLSVKTRCTLIRWLP
jgi:hypothetical protein